MKRTLALGISCGALVLTGCSGDGGTPPVVVTTTTEPPSDAQLIREVVFKQFDLFQRFDFVGLAELTCAKYKDATVRLIDAKIPPISRYGTPEELASISRESVLKRFKEQFVGASGESLQQFVDAVIANDEAAYRRAFIAVTRQIVHISNVKVDTIRVRGNEARAEITATTKIANKPEETETKTGLYIKEDGVWKDCADPNGSE